MDLEALFFSLTVSQLNSYLSALLEGDEFLSSLWVEGEISNIRNHTRGHLFFTLKDETSQIQCVMWYPDTLHLRFTPENGLKVLAHGSVKVYPSWGQYQLYTDYMIPAGEGEWQKLYRQLYEEYQKKGYFDESRKRPLPRYPQCVALVTSPQGAVIHDMKRILWERYPPLRIIVVPTLVQGENAPFSIASALRKAGQIPEVEVIILARGGGSTEDLWAFNQPEVIEAIYETPVPVVSAVGHEVDYTLSDYVADLRAPTPSAAAQHVAPHIEEVRNTLDELSTRLYQGLSTLLNSAQQRLEACLQSPTFHQFTREIEERKDQVADFLQRLHHSAKDCLIHQREQIRLLAGRLEAMSPLQVLSRGYSVLRKPDGSVIRRVEEVEEGDHLHALVSNGQFQCEVIGKEEIDARGGHSSSLF